MSDFHSVLWRIYVNIQEMMERVFTSESWFIFSPPHAGSTSAVLLTEHCFLQTWTAGLFLWKFISMLRDFLLQDVKTKTSIFQSLMETCTTLYFPLCLDEHWLWLYLLAYLWCFYKAFLSKIQHWWPFTYHYLTSEECIAFTYCEISGFLPVLLQDIDT